MVRGCGCSYEQYRNSQRGFKYNHICILITHVEAGQEWDAAQTEMLLEMWNVVLTKEDAFFLLLFEMDW